MSIGSGILLLIFSEKVIESLHPCEQEYSRNLCKEEKIMQNEKASKSGMREIRFQNQIIRIQLVKAVLQNV